MRGRVTGLLMLLALTGLLNLLPARSQPTTPIVSEESLLPEDFDGLTEARTGFDDRTNGYVTQAQFDKDRDQFNQIEEVKDGLGPVFNARSCAECHFNPVMGGNSQVTEIRSGHFDGTIFTESPGGSLIHSRAIDPAIQERILADQEVIAQRLTPSLQGLGYVEALDNATLAGIAAKQPPGMRGQVVNVLILEEGTKGVNDGRVGRFGHKDQHGSLLSFSADAYLNEVGITSPLAPRENLSNGRPVGAFDKVADPEDKDGVDIRGFARFMRALKAPPRDTTLAATAEAKAGQALFLSIGCAVCHVPALRTANPGTLINDGAFEIPDALGAKVIRPYGDFLLHDLDTGDGIVMAGMPQSTRLKIRTAPLWGLRTRQRLMHDGLSFTRQDAIARHGGEAAAVRARYTALPAGQKVLLLTFLRSL